MRKIAQKVQLKHADLSIFIYTQTSEKIYREPIKWNCRVHRSH